MAPDNPKEAARLPLETPEPPRAPRRHRIWPWAVLLIVGLVVAAVFLSKQRPPAAAQRGGRGGRGGGPPAPMVSTARASKGDIGVFVTALGVVTPVNTVAVKSRVDGQLVKVFYTEGQNVKAGDPLVEIDPSPFQAALTQAQGQFERDSALLENAKVDFERYKEAFAKNAIPKQQLDTQMAAVHQYEGAVRLDQGQLENARVQLGYCHINAPISGRVGLRLVDTGNIVKANDTNPLVIITQFEPITVIFSVAEDYLPAIQEQLRKGRELVVDAYDRAQQKKLETGKLQTLDNQIDASTGTIRLKALFENKDETLFPNQFVNARLLIDTEHGVTLVPNTVIQRNAQGAFVYLITPEQTVSLRTITAGTTDGTVTAVKGIEPGAMLAADNFNRLTENAKVTVRGSGEFKGGGGRPGPGGAFTNQGRGNFQRATNRGGGGPGSRKGEHRRE